jgi:hypothetical protein
MGATLRSVGDVGGQLAAIRGTIAYYERTSEGVQHTVELDGVRMLLYDGWVHVMDYGGDMWLPRERVESVTPE